MFDAQSIVVASTAARWYGRDGDILRYIFFHNLSLVGSLFCFRHMSFPG
jgi:lactate permease